MQQVGFSSKSILQPRLPQQQQPRLAATTTVVCEKTGERIYPICNLPTMLSSCVVP